jgi:hypothetical protein
MAPRWALDLLFVGGWLVGIASAQRPAVPQTFVAQNSYTNADLHDVDFPLRCVLLWGSHVHRLCVATVGRHSHPLAVPARSHTHRNRYQTAQPHRDLSTEGT